MKSALITGSSGGIGKAVCRRFVESGFRVVGIDLQPVQHEDLWETLEFDLAREYSAEDFRRLHDQVLALTGGNLHVLVNNAALQVVKEFDQITALDWQKTLQTNLMAPFWLTRHFVEELNASRGSVVNIASIHASLTKRRFTCYSTSKGALVALTRSMALELAPGVRVNAVLPAAIDTPMLREGFEGVEAKLKELGESHPARRIGRPEEVANLVHFLADDAAGFITGAAYGIDGGIGGVLHDPG